MALLYYLIFLLVSYSILMQIFTLTTYHRYFLKSLPLLVTYSVAVGFLLFWLNLHAFFIWHLVANILLLFFGWRHQKKHATAFFDAYVEAENRLAVEMSVATTTAYYLLSAIIYLVVFSISYLTFLNTLLP